MRSRHEPKWIVISWNGTLQKHKRKRGFIWSALVSTSQKEKAPCAFWSLAEKFWGRPMTSYIPPKKLQSSYGIFARKTKRFAWYLKPRDITIFLWLHNCWKQTFSFAWWTHYVWKSSAPKTSAKQRRQNRRRKDRCIRSYLLAGPASSQTDGWGIPRTATALTQYFQLTSMLVKAKSRW